MCCERVNYSACAAGQPSAAGDATRTRSDDIDRRFRSSICAQLLTEVYRMHAVLRRRCRDARTQIFSVAELLLMYCFSIVHYFIYRIY